MTKGMATTQLPVDLTPLDNAIGELTRWLTEQRISPTSEQLDPKVGAVICAIGELKSFAARFDPSLSLWEAAREHITPDRFEKRLEHEWLSQVVADKARKLLNPLDTLIKDFLAPLEFLRQKHDLVPRPPPGKAEEFEAEAERLVDQTLQALRPLLLAAAKQVPWSPGFKKIHALAADPDATAKPATSLARLSRHLLAISIDLVAALGEFSLHASEIPTNKQGLSTVLTLATACLYFVDFKPAQIARLIPDGGDEAGRFDRVRNRIRAARKHGLEPPWVTSGSPKIPN